MAITMCISQTQTQTQTDRSSFDHIKMKIIHMSDVGTTVHFRRQNTPWPHVLEACKWPKELAVVVGVAVQKLPPYFVVHRFSVHTGQLVCIQCCKCGGWGGRVFVRMYPGMKFWATSQTLLIMRKTSVISVPSSSLALRYKL